MSPPGPDLQVEHPTDRRSEGPGARPTVGARMWCVADNTLIHPHRHQIRLSANICWLWIDEDHEIQIA